MTPSGRAASPLARAAQDKARPSAARSRGRAARSAHRLWGITSDCASRPKNKCLVPAEPNRLANQGDHGLRVGSNDFLRVVGVQPTGYRATDGSTNRNVADLACRVIEPPPSRDHCRRTGNPAGARRRVRPEPKYQPDGGSVEDHREGRQPWVRSPNARSAQNLWMDLSVAQILAKVADSDSFRDAGCTSPAHIDDPVN
jgi:hypothetical protein